MAHGAILIGRDDLSLVAPMATRWPEFVTSPRPWQRCPAWNDLWGKWGGSIVMMDLDARTTVAYTMNQIFQGRGGDYRGLGIVLAACDALEG
jgi:hypothetical protein